MTLPGQTLPGSAKKDKVGEGRPHHREEGTGKLFPPKAVHAPLE